MKHVEQIKAIILLLLVSLSLVLTFLIWSYTPDYQIIEDPKGEKVKLGEEKELYDVIKPYRILSHDKNSLLGMVKSSHIDQVMKTLASLKAADLQRIQENLPEEYFNTIIHSKNHMTLFFAAEVPLATFGSILEFPQDEIMEGSFSHLVIDWNDLELTGKLRLNFLSEEKRTLFTANVKIGKGQFALNFMDIIQNSIAYSEVEREGQFSLYIPEGPIKLKQYKYFFAELSVDKMEEILFKDTNIVEKSNLSDGSKRYHDGMAIMIINANDKTINYVNPKGSISVIDEADLLQDSFDFLNDHGGLTGDYRFADSNKKYETKYQLFMEDLPVFSEITSTRITTLWDQIFQYKRPYYLFDVEVGKEDRELLPSHDIIDSIANLNEIDEILLGYYLERDPESPQYPVYILKPSWFVIQDGEWSRIMPETLGGTEDGLE